MLLNEYYVNSSLDFHHRLFRHCSNSNRLEKTFLTHTDMHHIKVEAWSSKPPFQHDTPSQFTIAMYVHGRIVIDRTCLTLQCSKRCRNLFNPYSLDQTPSACFIRFACVNDGAKWKSSAAESFLGLPCWSNLVVIRLLCEGHLESMHLVKMRRRLTRRLLDGSKKLPRKSSNSWINHLSLENFLLQLSKLGSRPEDWGERQFWYFCLHIARG